MNEIAYLISLCTIHKFNYATVNFHIRHHYHIWHQKAYLAWLLLLNHRHHRSAAYLSGSSSWGLGTYLERLAGGGAGTFPGATLGALALDATLAGVFASVDADSLFSADSNFSTLMLPSVVVSLCGSFSPAKNKFSKFRVIHLRKNPWKTASETFARTNLKGLPP